MGAPQENPITAEPATAENCTADRDAARESDGPGQASYQLGDARTQGNQTGGTR